LGLRVPSKAGRAATRSNNLRLVLQHLFGGEPLSRADIARATDLTAATVSTLISELEAIGLVAEVGPRREGTQVGKPPTMLQIQAAARNVIAVDLSDPETAHAAVVDLTGRILARSDVPTRDANGDDAVGVVTQLISQTLNEATAPILGIGVGTPGVVSADGVVVEAANFGWHGVELRQQLEESFDLPVYVRNDANAAAIAEYSRGDHDYTNLAVVQIGSGVGAGFVLNGQPYEGQHAGAGEIGHLVVDADGPLCRCGHHGCLETYVALPSISAALQEGNADHGAVRQAAAEKLGVALAAIVAILDIDHILIAGPGELLGEHFCDDVLASLRTRCLDNVSKSVSVRFTPLGADIVLLGAAGVVLSQELGVA
ncbi:MAG: ROK family transcriptional regulator, partial [Acidimicrobiales bacterium]